MQITSKELHVQCLVQIYMYHILQFDLCTTFTLYKYLHTELYRGRGKDIISIISNNMIT